jgi:hypothetical protein
MEEQVIDDVCGKYDLPVFRQFFHDQPPGIVVGNIHFGHEPPEKPGDEMVIQSREFPGGEEASNRNLPAGVEKIVENLPELDPYVDIIRYKMDIVNQQRGRLAETLAQPGSLFGQVFSAVEPITFPARNIRNMVFGGSYIFPAVRQQAFAESGQKMRLAGTGRAIDIEEIPRSSLRQHQGEPKSHFIAAADNEIVETVSGVYRKIKNQLHRRTLRKNREKILNEI